MWCMCLVCGPHGVSPFGGSPLWLLLHDRYTTGLGLPLSRALAKAGNGWLGLDDTCVSSQAPPPSLMTASSSGSSGPASTSGTSRRGPGPYRASDDSPAAHIITHYWCVLEATDSVSSRAHESRAHYLLGAHSGVVCSDPLSHTSSTGTTYTYWGSGVVCSGLAIHIQELVVTLLPYPLHAHAGWWKHSNP